MCASGVPTEWVFYHFTSFAYMTLAELIKCGACALGLERARGEWYAHGHGVLLARGEGGGVDLRAGVCEHELELLPRDPGEPLRLHLLWRVHAPSLSRLSDTLPALVSLIFI